jgi:hypothetical protein
MSHFSCTWKLYDSESKEINEKKSSFYAIFQCGRNDEMALRQQRNANKRVYLATTISRHCCYNGFMKNESKSEVEIECLPIYWLID